MLRLGLASACLFAGGCVSLLNSVLPSGELETGVVYDALTQVVIPSCDRHVRGDGWQPHCVVRGTSGRTGFREGTYDRETKWTFEFACAKTDSPPSSPVWQLPAGDYVRILTPIRADILAAVEATGVEVSWASQVESRDGNAPHARFEIRYLRHRRTVAGEVIGTIAPAVQSSGPDTRYTDVKVTLREWTCK
jgi:hypothetical protein